MRGSERVAVASDLKVRIPSPNPLPTGEGFRVRSDSAVSIHRDPNTL